MVARQCVYKVFLKVLCDAQFILWLFLCFFCMDLTFLYIYISLLLPFFFLCFYSPVMPRFTEQVESAVEALSSNPSQPMDENEFIDASRLVYDGIRDIRKAVLMIRVSLHRFLFSTSCHNIKICFYVSILAFIQNKSYYPSNHSWLTFYYGKTCNQANSKKIKAPRA